MSADRRVDLTRVTFMVLFIVAMLAATLWVARPFIGPAIWATMVVVSTWGLLLRMQKWLWGKRSLAVAAMTLLLLLVVMVPMMLAVVTIVGNADEMVEFAKLVTSYHLPEKPPQWVVDLPLVGSSLERLWDQAAALGLRDLLPRLTPYAGNVTRWFVAQLGNVGFLLLQFLMTVVIAAVLYGMGEEAAALVKRFAARLGGDRGHEVLVLAAGAVRGVALGVGITAAVQALLSGIGLAMAGVPFSGLLTAVIFMLCIAQVGPVPILLPAVIWTFYTGHTGWAIFLLVVGIFVTTFDNVLRPLLIRMGADLSLLLIFAGVIGGLLAFGLVGIFVGPVVLAVAFTLLEAWIADDEPPLPPPTPEPEAEPPAA